VLLELNHRVIDYSLSLLVQDVVHQGHIANPHHLHFPLLNQTSCSLNKSPFLSIDMLSLLESIECLALKDVAAEGVRHIPVVLEHIVLQSEEIFSLEKELGYLLFDGQGMPSLHDPLSHQ
jgi:hypothetical protein